MDLKDRWGNMGDGRKIWEGSYVGAMRYLVMENLTKFFLAYEYKFYLYFNENI